MRHESRANTEERLAELFAAIDDSSRSGGHADSPTMHGLELAEQRRLREAEACVQLIRQALSNPADATNGFGAASRGESIAGATPSPATSTIPDGERQRPRLVVRPPSFFGRFRLDRELGRGGSGFVFLASDPTLNRCVALKLPRPEVLTTPALRDRFIREGRAAATLHHPGIVQVLEAGEVGIVGYIAFEYCAGDNLAQWLVKRREPPPIRAAALWTRQLAEAVAYAHSQGIVHRDLKPANILLTAVPAAKIGANPDDRGPDLVPRITDFGLAKDLFDRSDATRSGVRLGTPRYMAPEQTHGSPSSVGAPADVHALGLIFYELLTGRPAFPGETDIEAIRQVQDLDPVRPGKLRPAVPRDLEAICLKCVRKEPRLRYGTAVELADDLGRFLDGRSTLARPLRWREQAAKWCRRRPAAAGLIAVSTLALFLLIVGGAYHMVSQDRAMKTIAGYVKEQERTLKIIADSLVEKESALKRIAQQEVALGDQLYNSEIRRAFQSFKTFNRAETLEILQRLLPKTGEPDRRGFEWHYLWGELHLGRRSFRAHDGEVYCLEFSPDGKTLATCGQDNLIRLWDRATGAARGALAGHTGEVNYVAWFKDGRRIASVSDDKTVRVWDAASGKQLAAFSGHDGLVNCVAVQPGGKLIASGQNNGRARLWDVAAGAESAGSKALQKSLGDLFRPFAFSPDGRRLALAATHADVANHYAIVLWNVEEHIVAERLRGHWGHGMCHAQFSPSGDRLATVDSDGCVKIWAFGKPIEIATLRGHLGSIESIAYSPDGKSLATAGGDQTVRIWDVAAAKLRHVLQGHTARVWCVAYSPDGKTLASCDADKNVNLWDLDWTPGKQTMRLPPPYSHSEIQTTAASRDGTVLALGIDWPLADSPVEFSPDGGLVAACGLDQTLQLLDGKSLKTRAATKPLDSRICRLAYSPDGRMVGFGTEDGGVSLLEVPSMKVRPLPRVSDAPAAVLRFTPDSQRLCLLDCENQAEVWTVHPSPACQMSRKVDKALKASAFSPDCMLLAGIVAEQIGGIESIPFPAPGKSRGLDAGKVWIRTVAFSPDGTLVASVSEGGDPAFSIMDAATGKRLASFGGHYIVPWAPQCARALALSNDKRTLATGTDSGRLTLWDITSGAMRRQHGLARRPPIHGIAYTRSGDRIAAAALDGAVIIYDVASDRVIAETAGLPPVIVLDSNSNPDGANFEQPANGRNTQVSGFTKTVLVTGACRGGAFSVSDDGSLLAANRSGNALQVLDIERAEEILGDHRNSTSAVITPGGQRMITTDLLCSDRLGVYDVPRKRRISDLVPLDATARPNHVVLSPDGKSLVTSMAGTWEVYDSRSLQRIARIPSGGDGIEFSHDGKWAATGTQNFVELRKWVSPETSRFRLTHTSPPVATAFCPTGRTVATVSHDGQLHFWSLATGNKLMQLAGFTSATEGAQLLFSPDGRQLLGIAHFNGGKSRQAFVWMAAPADPAPPLRN